MAAKKSTPTDSGKAAGKAKAGKAGKAGRQSSNRPAQLVVATNRKARHDYQIIDTYEAGIVLVGTEIKALRESKGSLVEAYATIDDGEVWLRNLYIPEYSHGHWTNHSPRRTRKLLLHRREIDYLIGKTRDGNTTLVPLQLYLVNGRLKVELGLARGKQEYDKRQDIKRRTEEREVTRTLGRRIKGINA